MAQVAAPGGIGGDDFQVALNRSAPVVTRDKSAPADQWRQDARRLVRRLLAEAGVSQKELSRRLDAVGVDLSPSAIASRLHRGSVSVCFLLQIASALGIASVSLEPTASRQAVQGRSSSAFRTDAWYGVFGSRCYLAGRPLRRGQSRYLFQTKRVMQRPLSCERHSGPKK
jgi:transcriptional regulator with XRE-family HTH domain